MDIQAIRKLQKYSKYKKVLFLFEKGQKYGRKKDMEIKNLVHK